MGPYGRLAARLVLVLTLAVVALPARAGDDTLQEAQNILLMLGYHPGKSDGNMRPQTTQALTEFQRTNKLTASGKLDEPTMALLRKLRDTKFTGKLGTPDPVRQAERRNAVEPKPQAAPVDRVASESVGAAPGGRMLSGSTTLGPGTAAGGPPPLFNAPSTSGPSPLTANRTPGVPAGGSISSEPEKPPFLGIMSWTWAIPLLGLPLMGFLWWFGMRRQGGAGLSETAEDLQHRREPNLGEAAPASGPRRGEPRL